MQDRNDGTQHQTRVRAWRQQRRRAFTAAREERRAEAAAERQEARRRDEAWQRAERESKKLRQHLKKLEPLEAAWESALQRFYVEDKPGFAAFAFHAFHASVVNAWPVRFFDHLRWYKHVPQYVRVALNAMAHYYHNECSIRVQLNRYEQTAGSWAGQLGEEEEVGATYGWFPIDEQGNQITNRNAPGDSNEDSIPQPDIIPPGIESLGYGLDTSPRDHIRTTRDCGPVPAFSGQREEVAFLRAAFELRKVRLEHESSKKLRFPEVRPFPRSLDHSFLVFIQRVLVLYADLGKSPKKELTPALVAVLRAIHEYGERINDRRIKIERLPRAIEEKSNLALRLEMSTGDPSVDENDLPGLQQQVEETTRLVEWYQDELADAMEDTIAENPYDSQVAAPHRPETGIFS